MTQSFLHKLDEEDKEIEQVVKEGLRRDFGGTSVWFGFPSKTSLRRTERDYNGAGEDWKELLAHYS